MKKNEIIGVITGDLVNSSVLTDQEKESLKKELNTFTKGNSAVILPLQFYRGDSFQFMCAGEQAAWLSIMIQAILIAKVNTVARISIGLGSVDRIHEKDVLQSEGEAFILSGHQLDGMKDEGRLFKIAISSESLKDHLEITSLLVENLFRDWKQGQASVVAMNPRFETQRNIAEKLKITPAAVSKTLKACKWQAVNQYLDWYERVVKNNTNE